MPKPGVRALGNLPDKGAYSHMMPQLGLKDRKNNVHHRGTERQRILSFLCLSVPLWWTLRSGAGRDIAAGLLRHYDGTMNLGFPEMIFIFFLALIIFGPKKLPEIGRQIGKALNEFKRASNEFKAQIESEINNLDADVRAPEILPPYRKSEDTVPSGTLVDAPDPVPVSAANHAPEVHAKAAPDA